MEVQPSANEADPRGYEAALAALSGLIHQRKRADGSNWGDAFALMHSYVKVLELEGPLDQLSIIHVAGTKGKGSTCALTEAMLRASGHSTALFTSPHLVDVRERFRINGEMVPVETFLRHFWWCYDRFQAAASAPSAPIPMPAYFRFLTLLALRIFTQSQVDVAILEVGIGGRFDATNVVPRPAVCGISSLGFDHMELLGNTLALIAGEKAGIFKPGVPAVTAPQEAEAMEVLKQRAAELKIPLELAKPWDEIAPGVRVGLAGKHQRINASLAVSLCRQWATRSGREEEARAINEALANKTLPPAYITGLGNASWPGRCEILQDCPTEPSEGGGASGQLKLFLDGAHTVESMEVCGEWFCDASGDEGERCGPKEGLESGGLKEGGEEGGQGGEAGGAVLKRVGDSAVAAGEELAASLGDRTVGALGTTERKAKTIVRVLLFNCMPERSPPTLMSQLLHTLEERGVSIHRAFFVPSLSSYTSLLPSSSSSTSSHPTATTPQDSTSPQQTDSSSASSEPTSHRSEAGVPSQSSSFGRSSLAWQLSMQQTWEQLRQGSEDATEHGIEPDEARSIPSSFIVPNNPSVQPFASVPDAAVGTAYLAPNSAVLPSLPAAIDLLRWTARMHPDVQIQVLVTGSLHLVGDVLRVVRGNKQKLYR